MPLRIQQFNTHLVPKLGCKPTKRVSSSLKESHWLAGFIQGDGSFQIKLLKVKTRLGLRVQLTMQISLKTELLLTDIKQNFGGYIGFRKSHNTYYYSSGSFVNAAKFIQYLDYYQVMGAKFRGYRLWKKAFEQVQNNAHLSSEGLETLKELKTLLSSVKK